jgi:DNA-binding NarL/FixJ family response regulator
MIVDSVGSITEAARMVDIHRTYRVVLLDFVLPDARGFSGFLRLQRALGDVPILIISAHQQPELIEAASALGAAGYLSKSQSFDGLVGTLRSVVAGKAMLPRTAACDDDVSLARRRLADLSGAQLRVLMALADGRLNKQIAGDLGVTEATIKAHMTVIFRKLGVSNRTQAILAMQPLLRGTAEQLV